VHDAQGKHLVIEFIDGKLSVINNPNGVMTNFPSLEWQLTNLRNYIHLTPLNTPPMTLGKVVLEPTGQGIGFYGIPGDYSSPSRFVRASFFKAFVVPAATAPLGVNLMEHLLNTFDIPVGLSRGSASPSSFEQTQWIVIKDLKNKKLYYRTYEDLTLRQIDLTKLDFTPSSKRPSLPMIDISEPIDMTSKLFTAKK
jgi:choloylglycine hydrolase